MHKELVVQQGAHFMSEVRLVISSRDTEAIDDSRNPCKKEFDQFQRLRQDSIGAKASSFPPPTRSRCCLRGEDTPA